MGDENKLRLLAHSFTFLYRESGTPSKKRVSGASHSHSVDGNAVTLFNLNVRDSARSRIGAKCPLILLKTDDIIARL
jgi:hypothetical protein